MPVACISAGVGESELAAPGVEHPVEARDEHRFGDVRLELGIDASQYLPGVLEPRRCGPQHRARGCHHQGGGNAFVGDVTDYDADPALSQLDEVIEVPSNLASRLVVGVETPAVGLRSGTWEEVLLDQTGDAHFLL